ncbi:ATP-binding protein, partial [Rugamonas sp. FT81W]|nr:ATP-binding protein [Duganella vulcania]
MASERALKLGAVASVAALMALAAVADIMSATPEPRRVVLCGLAALVPAIALWQCLRRLAPRPPRMEAQDSTMLHGAASAGRELADTLHALEARLEHAPIALFSIQNAAGAGAVAPL